MKTKCIWSERQRSPIGIWAVVNETRGKRRADPLPSLVPQYDSSDNFFVASLTSSWKILLLRVTTICYHWIICHGIFKKNSPNDVFRKLSELSPGKVTGSDLIPAKLLIVSAFHIWICKILSIIFNHSIEERKLPSHLKYVHVCPVRKSLRLQSKISVQSQYFRLLVKILNK